jgi:hypothetical protein
LSTAENTGQEQEGRERLSLEVLMQQVMELMLQLIPASMKRIRSGHATPQRMLLPPLASSARQLLNWQMCAPVIT